MDVEDEPGQVGFRCGFVGPDRRRVEINMPNSRLRQRAKGPMQQHERQVQGISFLNAERLGSGSFNEVLSLNKSLVVKLAKSWGPFVQPISWLKRNRQEHELAARYLPVPPTYHVYARDQQGNPVNMILQRRIHGRVLSQVPDRVLYSAKMRDEMEGLVRGLEECRQELGWLPDVIGGPLRWGQHDLRRSNNLFLDTDGRIWLIDPGAFFFWFSSRNPVGRVYTWILLQSARRMLSRTSKADY